MIVTFGEERVTEFMYVHSPSCEPDLCLRLLERGEDKQDLDDEA